MSDTQRAQFLAKNVTRISAAIVTAKSINMSATSNYWDSTYEARCVLCVIGAIAAIAWKLFADHSQPKGCHTAYLTAVGVLAICGGVTGAAFELTAFAYIVRLAADISGMVAVKKQRTY